MTIEKVTNTEVLRYIKDFEKNRKMRVTPSQLAYNYNVSITTIYRKLKELKELGRVELIKKNKYIVDYKIIYGPRKN